MHFRIPPALLMLAVLLMPSLAQADRLDITLEIPALEVDPYHRPFVAIWLETPKRKGVATFTVLYDDAEWLKDLRQWWRKQGRRMKDVDGVSSASRKPGQHTLQWQTPDVPAGDYLLCFEAAREAGGREFVHIPVQLGDSGQQTYEALGQHELGHIAVRISPE